jgi:hypothetical protein
VNVFFLNSRSGGMESELGPVGTSATSGLLYLHEDGEFGGTKYSEKTCHSATLSTINPTWPDPGDNPGRRGRKPATNRLSYGAASSRALPLS